MGSGHLQEKERGNETERRASRPSAPLPGNADAREIFAAGGWKPPALKVLAAEILAVAIDPARPLGGLSTVLQKTADAFVSVGLHTCRMPMERIHAELVDDLQRLAMIGLSMAEFVPLRAAIEERLSIWQECRRTRRP